MISAFERTVAFRYLRSRRQEGFISVTAGFSLLGICLGVAALIIVMSVMNGFRYELISRILGFNGHVTVIGSGGFNIGNYEEMALRLEEIDGVLTAMPMIEGQVLATSPNAQAGALVRGVTRDDLEGQSLIADNVKLGSLAEFGTTPGVIVGAQLLRRLGLSYGDNITLISPKGVPTAFGTVPRSVAYPVIGVFEVGMYEFDSSVVFMPLDQAQIYFRLEDAVTQVELTIETPESPQAVRQAARAIADPFNVVDWQQTNRHLYGALQVERNVMFLILTLIIVVAAFNIISSLIMLVKDKSADIAIMRTMGATRGSLMRIFLLTGASIGVVGTVAGLVIGIVFCLNIESIRQFIQYLTKTELFPAEVYFLAQLPARVEWVEVASIVVMALVLTFLATLYPAWRAARIDPAEALRYE
jgi:lipoprotein-releasing system permease protein